MDTYKGKTILVVNTATKCGLTPQFAGLEELHKTYKEQGLVILGFPCNQFLGQEPVSNENMEETCLMNHGVTFQLMEKIDSTTETKVENDKTGTIYDYTYQTPKGETKSFKTFEGKVILIVNTATECGLTPQFAGLETMNSTYAKKGLVVLGFPCNQFDGQEPVSNEEMVENCKINHGVTFELTSKI
eukprot:maker-scaffold949_size77582-snap-gene-0.0 protein:Tk01206 transcript:maker-scaffold949_size77582-snap-gene-0.0-mRNA-1 annotation:"glutathione peroxidase"